MIATQKVEEPCSNHTLKSCALKFARTPAPGLSVVARRGGPALTVVSKGRLEQGRTRGLGIVGIWELEELELEASEVGYRASPLHGRWLGGRPLPPLWTCYRGT